MTKFWDGFYSKCDGHDVKRPVLIHNMGEEEWKAVGRIIVDGYKLMDYFPIKLAEQLFEDALFGESRADLIEEYLHTVSPVEQTVLRNAMGSFNDIDLEELCDIRVPTIALSCQQLEALEELSRKFCRDQSFDVGNQSLKQLCISQVQSLTRSMTKKLATVNKLLQLMKYRQNQFMNDIFWYSFLSQKKIVIYLKQQSYHFTQAYSFYLFYG